MRTSGHALNHCRGLEVPVSSHSVGASGNGPAGRNRWSKLRHLASVAFDCLHTSIRPRLELGRTSIGVRCDVNLAEPALQPRSDLSRTFVQPQFAWGRRGLSSRTFLTETIVSRFVSLRAR